MSFQTSERSNSESLIGCVLQRSTAHICRGLGSSDPFGDVQVLVIARSYFARSK